MSINPITGIVIGAANPQTTQRAATGSSASPSAISGSTAYVADQTAVSAPQTAPSISSLYQAALALAQNVSLSQTAGQAINSQQDVLAQLQQLASEASDPNTAQSARAQLDNVFQNLLAALDQIGSTTSFNGQPLLTGSFSVPSDNSGADGTTGNSGLSLPDLTANGLFGSASPNLQSPDSAQSAVQALQQAATTLNGANEAASNFGQQVQYASATVESSLFNQAAAGSTLSEADFTQSPVSFTADVLQQTQSQLPPSLLSLLSA